MLKKMPSRKAQDAIKAAEYYVNRQETVEADEANEFIFFAKTEYNKGKFEKAYELGLLTLGMMVGKSSDVYRNIEDGYDFDPSQRITPEPSKEDGFT